MSKPTHTTESEEPLTEMPDLIHWQGRVDEIRIGQLANVRTTAEKWRSGISALVTVIAGAALIGKPTISTHGTTAILALLLWAMGVLGLSIALLSSMRASFGMPGARMKLFPETVAEWEAKETGASRAWLRTAWIAAPLGVLGVLFAVVLASLA